MSVRARQCAIAAAWGLFEVACAGNAVAAGVDGVTVSHSHDGFRIAFDAVVDAPAQQVYKVLSDYARLGKLNPVIMAISVESSPTGHGERVRSVIMSCVWIFCRDLVQVEDVTESSPNMIAAQIVPGAGDFASGWCFWRITSDGARTRLRYEAARVADFWIPPLIGPWAIERTLREHLQSSIEALEHAANQTAPH